MRYKDARDKVKELKVSGTSKDDVSALFININKKGIPSQICGVEYS